MLIATSLSAAAADNDATCDIALLPAATLRLPYVEVDPYDRHGQTTYFTSEVNDSGGQRIGPAEP